MHIWCIKVHDIEGFSFWFASSVFMSENLGWPNTAPARLKGRIRSVLFWQSPRPNSYFASVRSDIRVDPARTNVNGPPIRYNSWWNQGGSALRKPSLSKISMKLSHILCISRKIWVLNSLPPQSHEDHLLHFAVNHFLYSVENGKPRTLRWGKP